MQPNLFLVLCLALCLCLVAAKGGASSPSGKAPKHPPVPSPVAPRPAVPSPAPLAASPSAETPAQPNWADATATQLLQHVNETLQQLGLAFVNTLLVKDTPVKVLASQML